MTDREKQEYELALRIGNDRFGSPCQHKETRGGRCTNCSRLVYLTRGTR